MTHQWPETVYLEPGAHDSEKVWGDEPPCFYNKDQLQKAIASLKACGDGWENISESDAIEYHLEGVFLDGAEALYRSNSAFDPWYLLQGGSSDGCWQADKPIDHTDQTTVQVIYD